MSDLELALNTLAAKCKRHDHYIEYYEGTQPLVYNAEKLRDIFTGLDARFTENWCGVVVDSVLDRIELQGFTVANNEALTKRLNDLYKRTELDLDADSAHQQALVTGEGYIIVWREDGGDIEAFWNDSRQCHIFYESDNPRAKRFAAKWWKDEEDHRFIQLYYADQVEYYKSIKPVKQSEQLKDNAFMMVDADGQPTDTPAENPFSRIPVFHFRRERNKVRSELANIIEPQNALNKLVSDMMVAAEFGAFRQRYAISQADVRGKLKNSPNEIWTIPASDGEGQPTTVGEFSATDLGNYVQTIDQRANAIAVISRTPKHYFFSQAGVPSGEALIVQEAPLNKKAQRYVSRFASAWRKVAAFLLELDGVAVDEMAIEPMFAEVATVQPRTAAEIRQINVNAGMPLITVLKAEGWSQREIDEMLNDADEMSARQQAGIGAALLNAQQSFDRGEDVGANDANT